jgi:hypothetical protein
MGNVDKTLEGWKGIVIATKLSGSGVGYARGRY